MEKNIYWLIESNSDLSNTCKSIEECAELLTPDFESFDLEEQLELQYTITPVYYTDEEYENLPEA